MSTAIKDICLSFLDENSAPCALLRLWPVGEPSRQAAKGAANEALHKATLMEGLTYGYELTRADGIRPLEATIEPRELFEPERPGAHRGRLRLGNRAGVLVIVITPTAEWSSSVSVEVASAKLRYEEEYRWMLRDITSELAEVALARFGPTQSRYAPIDRGEPTTLYQRFAFLKAVLDSNEYHGALQQVLTHPYVGWVQGTHRRETSRGLRATHATVRAMAAGGPSRRLHEPLGTLRAVPREVPEQRLISTTDNVPNQFIRALLEDWRGLAQSVQDALAGEEATHKRTVAAVVRGLSESNHLISNLDAALATPLFRGTSPLRQMPVANQVLLRRPGYRELVRIHEQAQLAATLTWDGADLVFGAGQRDVATLYEYWVFLQIARIVSDFCGQAFDYAGLFQVSDTGLQLNLRKRRAQVVKGSVEVADLTLHIGLWFNRPFSRVRGESWSRDMRPDLSLGIGLSAEAKTLERVWLHFDAKYRVERLFDILGEEDVCDVVDNGDDTQPQERALREDLLKMHAYRDAIRRSSGAYVVYPGDGRSSVNETFLEYHELLPGLGAFGLRPTENGPVVGESGIRAFIKDSLHHVGDVLSQDRRANHWVHTVMGDPPKPARTMPIASRAVEGLWFLERPPADEPILLVGSTGEVVWVPAPQLLFFRTDGVATLPARVFRSAWAALALPGDAVALLLLEDEAAVERPSVDITLGPGVWLGVRATQREESPDWLTAPRIDDLLRGRDSMLTTWEELARRILVETLESPP